MVKYYFSDHPESRKIKRLCNSLIDHVPELDYIERFDFEVIIALEKAPKDNVGMTRYADMGYSTNWFREWIGYLRGKELSPFILRVYPIFFTLKFEDKVHVLIHELFHIPPNKRGVRDHTGFGDEQITKIFLKNKGNLRRLQK